MTPAVVSPDGGEIYLYPLIPAPTGAQSRGDVIEAIRGLSEVARIERWDGSSWAAVGEIQLREADEDLALGSRPTASRGRVPTRPRGTAGAARRSFLGRRDHLEAVHCGTDVHSPRMPAMASSVHSTRERNIIRAASRRF